MGLVDSRLARLRSEWAELQSLQFASDAVRVEAPLARPGNTPDRFRLTFLCRGVVGISPDGDPQFGNAHSVEIHCGRSFPTELPRLRWLTPVWHPNILNVEPFSVCVNKAEWVAGMTLVDLGRQMFEMVQYRNYHAEHRSPYPLDPVAAQWVRDVAEPRGYVDKRRNKGFDDKPFTRPTPAGMRALRG